LPCCFPDKICTCHLVRGIGHWNIIRIWVYGKLHKNDGRKVCKSLLICSAAVMLRIYKDPLQCTYIFSVHPIPPPSIPGQSTLAINWGGGCNQCAGECHAFANEIHCLQKT
jgi:hypothetical protein